MTNTTIREVLQDASGAKGLEILEFHVFQSCKLMVENIQEKKRFCLFKNNHSDSDGGRMVQDISLKSKFLGRVIKLINFTL